MVAVTIGIDIGQKVDPTAIAVVESEQRAVAGRMEPYYLVRHLERLPLGTSYPDVARRLAEIVAGVRKRAVGAGAVERTISINPITGAGQISYTVAQSLSVYVDATGVGQPVVDLLRAGGVKLWATYFTHGDRRTVNQDGTIALGKGWLVSRLQALLQTNRLLLPRTPEAEALGKELLDYEIKVSEDANERYGAFKVGAHDDLVTALGLAVQEEPGRPFTSAVGGERIAFRDYRVR